MKKRILSALLIVSMLTGSFAAALAASSPEDIEPPVETGIVVASGYEVSPLEDPPAPEGGGGAGGTSSNVLYAVSPDRKTLVSFSAGNPGTQTVVTSTAFANGTFPASKYYAAEYVSTSGLVYFIRPNNNTAAPNVQAIYTELQSLGAQSLGVLAAKGNLTSYNFDMAYDYSSGIMFYLRTTSATVAETSVTQLNYSVNVPGTNGTTNMAAVQAVTFNEYNPIAQTGTEMLVADGRMLALAIDKSGNGYGIYRSAKEEDLGQAYLYSIKLKDLNTTAGQRSTTVNCTLLGYTGFPTYNGPQSMAFDHSTGKLYWARSSNGTDGQLIELDTESGAGTPLGSTNGALAGLFFAPAQIPQIDTVTFEAADGGLLDGDTTVTFEKVYGQTAKLDAVDIPDVVPDTANGYTFAGWYSSDGYWTLSLVGIEIKGDTTFTAYFSKDGYKTTAAGSDLTFNTVGTYPWVAIDSDFNGKQILKSTNGYWGEQAIIEVEPDVARYSLETIYPAGPHHHNTSSSLTTIATLEAGDIVSFDYKVNANPSDRLYFRVNGEAQLTVTPKGSQATNTWNPSTAGNSYEYTVPADGEYLLEWTFQKSGTASYYADAAFIANVYAGAKADSIVSGIEIESDTYEVCIDNFIEIPYAITPEKAANAAVTWSSSNPSVATVSAKGRVKGVSEGTAEITVATTNGISDTCTVTVTDGAKAVRFYAYSTRAESRGWVTFSSDNPSDYTVIATMPEDVYVSAAEYVDDGNGSGTVYGYYFNIDLSSGAFFKSTLDNLGAYEVLNSEWTRWVYDMAYDYSTGTMYALCDLQDASRMRALYRVNLATGELTLVGILWTYTPIGVLAITTEGVAYGIEDSSGSNASFLREINLKTASTAYIDRYQKTGALLDGTQSMTYDHNTGRMFWAQFYFGYWNNNEFDSGLYEVNVDTGAGTKIGATYNNQAEYHGLMVVQSANVMGYYSDKGNTALNTNVGAVYGASEASIFRTALPTSGYAKLSDGGYEFVRISWVWRYSEPVGGYEKGKTYEVVGTITSGTFAYGKKIYGTVTFGEGAQAPTITRQPTDASVTQNSAATLSITASSPDGGALTYQWYRNSSNSNAGGTAIVGAVSSTYSPSTSIVGTTYYYVVVTNTLNNSTASVTSTAARVTVSAVSTGGTQNPSGGNPSGGNSTTVTTEDGTIVSQITVTPNTSVVGGVTTSTATVTGTAVANALAEAEKQSPDSNALIIEIKMTVAANAQAATLGLPASSLAAIAETENASLSLDMGFASITFDTKALETIAQGSGEGNVSVSVSKVDVTTLTQEAQSVVGNRPVFDIHISSGGTTISDLKGGTVSISVPYQPSSEERKNPDAIVVYYIDKDGNLQNVLGRYNAKTGMVEFETGHLSQYAVAYNLVSYPDVPAWAKAAVTFTAARGIVSYSGSFGPDETVTRGEFLIALMKTYAIDVSAPKDAYAFADVEKDSELYAYAAVARELGITDGADAARNLFAPDAVVERQQIAAFFVKALNAMGKLPTTDTGRALSDYADAGEVAAWAAPYVEAAVKAGLMNSTSNTEWVVDPALVVTRSQMVQLIYNLFV